jgi:hypothetical protein
MNWKERERKQLWPILRDNPIICLEGQRKGTKSFKQDSWFFRPRLKSKISRIQSRRDNCLKRISDMAVFTDTSNIFLGQPLHTIK